MPLGHRSFVFSSLSLLQCLERGPFQGFPSLAPREESICADGDISQAGQRKAGTRTGGQPEPSGTEV